MSHPVWSNPRWSVLEAILSFAGAGVAGTLWWAHRVHIELPCTANGACEEVANSPQAFVAIGPWHDVSVAFLGFLAYIALLTLSMAKLGTDSPATARRLHSLMWILSAFGLAYSWYLQYAAHFIIHAFCIYCFTSACLMTALFAVVSWEGRTTHRSKGVM